MGTDSINDEILRIKRELAGKFDNDLGRIVADAQSREQNTISFPPRRWKSGQNDALTPAIVCLPNGSSAPPAG